ncbi:MAG: SDR family oxidoreductase [Gammaproteobacteria bacterium]|nr:MAG: SDR family oxidoreductase [Gammaproteobacteria bacterium]
MSNRVAVIVGGTGDLGRLITARCADAGFDVVVVYRSATEQARALQQAVAAGGRRCLTLQADLRHPEEVERFVAAAIAEFGQIDVLVHAHGWLSRLQLFHECSIESLQQTIAVELLGVMYCCRAVLPHMIARRAGRIVTLASDSGKVGSSAEAASAAARGGVIALSKSLARENARHGITINVVCPGPIATESLERNTAADALTARLTEGMIRATPLRRLAQPQEVVDLVMYLATGGAGFITGQAISVSGGLTMC